MTADKTQFSPAIAALAMPDKNSSIGYAIGDGLSEYAKQQKLDTMFDTELAGKKLDQETKQFSLDTDKAIAPYKIQDAETSTEKGKLELDKENKAKEKRDMLETPENWAKEQQIKNNALIQSNNSTVISTVNAENAPEDKRLEQQGKKAIIENTQQTGQLTNYAIRQAKTQELSNRFFGDTNGDGVIDEKDFAQTRTNLQQEGIKEEDIYDAEKKAQERNAKLDSTRAEAARKQDLALGIDTKTKRINAMQNEGNTIAQGLGLASWEQLGQVDTTTLTPEQKVRLQSWGKSYSQAYDEKTGAKVQDMIISMNASQAQLQQVSSYTQEAIKKGDNVNLFKTVANQVASYVGGDVFDPELAMRNKLFQGALNTQLKIASGTAVSGNEFSRFKDETSTLYKSNPDLFVALKGIAMKQKAQLDGIRQVMGDAPFNAQFGDLKQRVNNLNNILNSATEGIQTEGDDSKRNVQFSASKTPPSAPQISSKKEGLPDPFAY